MLSKLIGLLFLFFLIPLRADDLLSVDLVKGRWVENCTDLATQGKKPVELKRTYSSCLDAFIQNWSFTLPDFGKQEIPRRKWTPPEGRQLDYVYDGKHRVIKAVLSHTKNRDVEGWLKIEYRENECKVSSNGGDWVVYRLAPNGGLEAIEKSDGTWCRYTYLEHPLERSYLISEKKESSGICMKLSYYDEKTRQNFKTGKIKDLYRSLDGGESYILLYHFDYEPGRTSVTDAQGVLFCYYYNQFSQIQAIKTFLEADLYRTEEMEWKNGRMVRKTEKDGAGHLLRQQRWCYDLHNNLIEEILEGTLTQEGKQLEAHHRKASYDLQNRIVEESEEEGIKVTYTYEGDLLASKWVWNGEEIVERTQFYYDSEGRLLQTLIDDQVAVYTFEKIDGYNGLDQPLTIQKGVIDLVTGEEVIQEQVTFTYDEKGSVLQESYLDHAIIYGKNEKRILEGNKETVFYFSPSGKLLQEEVYKNKKRLSSYSYTYNPLGQLVEKVENGNVTSYEYDLLGRKIKETLPAVLSPQDISISYTNSYIYDPLDRVVNANVRGQPLEGKRYTLSGRLERETYKDGSYCCFTYDHLGRVIKKGVYNSFDEEIKSQENFYLGSQLSKEKFSSGITIEHRYNSRGEKESSYCPETGRKIFYGQEKVSNEENEESMEWTQNDRGQTVLEKRHINPDGSFVTTLYDALQRPEKIESYLSTGALFSQKHLRYDARGRKIQERISGLTNSWEYDENGNLLAQIEAKGSLEERKTSFTYTASGKLETELHPSGTLICYEYNRFGELSRIKSENLDYELFYNKTGQVVEVIDHIHKLTTKRIYNLEGQVTSETLGNGLTIENQYDLSGKRISMTLPDSGSVEWNFEENLTKITRFSPSKELLYQSTKHPNSIEMIQNLGTITYERNQEGRIQKISSPYFEQEATYDSFRRLTALKTSDFQNDYTYLPNGFEENQQTYLFDSFENILRSGDYVNGLNQVYRGDTLSYDLAGNLIKKVSGTDTFYFSYDPLNRLIEVKKNREVIHSYVYDLYHRRISDLKQGIRYLYDGNEEIGSVDSQGKIRELRILPSVAFELDEEIYAPIYDISGSLAVLVHADTKQPAATYRYTAFGLSEESSPLSPWQYANKRLDPDTGLYHFGRRDYDPELMRFIEPDPLGFSDGVNKYAFCHNDPLNFKDRFGLQTERDGWETFTKGAVDFFSSVTSFFSSFQNPSYLTPKDVFEYSLGSGFLLLGGYYPTQIASGTYGKGEVSNQVRISYINGILTSHEGALSNVQSLSESHGNVNIHYVYRPTKGWTSDMLQGSMVVSGLVSEEAKRLANLWRQMIGEMGQEGKIIHYAHSLGAVETARALSLLTDEEKKRIHIYAFGSPSVGEANPYLQTHYYLSIADGVPLLDLPSYVKAASNSIPNVVFIGSSDSIPFIDHFFLNQTYQDIWKSMGRTFVDWYGTL